MLENTRSYVSIKPGETKVLKKGVKIVSVMNFGNVTYSAPCFPGLASEDAQCYKMMWGHSKEGSVLDLDARINYIEVLGVKYNFTNLEIYREVSHGYINSTEYDTNRFTDLLTSTLPASLIKGIDISIYIPSSSYGRVEYTLKFQTVQSVAASMEMKITGRGFLYGTYIRPVSCDDGTGTNDTPAT